VVELFEDAVPLWVVALLLLPELADCPALLSVELLLCAIANAPAATNTKRIPGNFFITVSMRVESTFAVDRLRCF